MNSKIPGFYKLSQQERLKIVSDEAGLTDRERLEIIDGGVDCETADNMVENAVGRFCLPYGVATNFLINESDILIPMVTEEPSVIAAASNAAKMARAGGGFKTDSTDPIMIGQIQVVNPGPDAKEKINAKKKNLMGYAQSIDPTLVKFGGGIVDLNVRDVNDMLVIHLHVNVADAMGANAINTMCEALAPKIEEITGGKAILKILSNYAVERISMAYVAIPEEALGGGETADRIILAYELAKNDVYRAVTHNKGIMNGVTAVCLATGNDTRAIEAGCHSFASKDGKYTSLTTWSRDSNGNLRGSIEIPTAVGIVGGATRTHPLARTTLKIMGVKSARQLGETLAAVGLAQNLAALRALASEGIQKGHMRLHAKNIAVTAGAKGKQIDKVAKDMIEKGRISVDGAREILRQY
jgi:hydroxymethylglutaryl-CoA reductase